jgi:hypothetical protein
LKTTFSEKVVTFSTIIKFKIPLNLNKYNYKLKYIFKENPVHKFKTVKSCHVFSIYIHKKVKKRFKNL